MTNTVIVVDMLKGFCREEFSFYCGPETKKIIPAIQDLLEKETAGGSTILYLVDTHEENDKEFEMFPPHCIRGTVECDVIPEIFEKFPGDTIPKSRYSGLCSGK